MSWDIEDNVEINIDIDNLLDGIDTINGIPEALEKGIYNGIQEICEKLQEKLVENLENYGLGDSNILNTLTIEPKKDGVSLQLGDYAIFVEYGTGIAGYSDQHPKADEVGWEYMSGKNSSLGGGWWYPTTDSDPNPHKHMYDGQLYAWTIAGEPSRPFIYDTWLWGSRSATNIMKKNIRAELKKMKGVK